MVRRYDETLAYFVHFCHPSSRWRHDGGGGKYDSLLKGGLMQSTPNQQYGRHGSQLQWKNKLQKLQNILDH